jgi:hypothetical protein
MRQCPMEKLKGSLCDYRSQNVDRTSWPQSEKVA